MREILSFVHLEFGTSLLREQFFEASSNAHRAWILCLSLFFFLNLCKTCEPFHAPRLRYTRITCTPLLDSLRLPLEFRPAYELLTSPLKSAVSCRRGTNPRRISASTIYVCAIFFYADTTCATYQATDLMNVMIRRQGNCFSEFTFIVVIRGVHKLVVLINYVFPRLSRE